MIKDILRDFIGLAKTFGENGTFEVEREELIYEEIGFDWLGRATVKGKLLVFRDNDNDRCLLIKTQSKGFKAMKLLSDNFTRMERTADVGEDNNDNVKYFDWLRL